MVPIETLRAGDELVLPLGLVVQVERVDRYDDGSYVVRWHSGAYYRAPHALAGQRHTLGSLTRRRRGDLVPAVTARDPEPPL